MRKVNETKICFFEKTDRINLQPNWSGKREGKYYQYQTVREVKSL